MLKNIAFLFPKNNSSVNGFFEQLVSLLNDTVDMARVNLGDVRETDEWLVKSGGRPRIG